MNDRSKTIGLAALVSWVGLTAASAQAPPRDGSKGGVSGRAKGTFEVKLNPVADVREGVASARIALDKTFQGDLTGTSKGEMWTADTNVKGSAGYVAIEKVSGSVRGRSGAFTLLHHGTMKRGGDFNLTIVVVPDSGTSELTGLTGKMAIIVADGEHSYEFDYTLPEMPTPGS